MSLKRPLIATARPCGHEVMFEQQLKRIEELSDTLQALTDKIECLRSSNMRLDLQLKAEKSLCRDYTANAVKQLADYEALSLELDEAHARASRLSGENDILRAALEKLTKSGELLLGDTGAIVDDGCK